MICFVFVVGARYCDSPAAPHSGFALQHVELRHGRRESALHEAARPAHPAALQNTPALPLGASKHLQEAEEGAGGGEQRQWQALDFGGGSAVFR